MKMLCAVIVSVAFFAVPCDANAGVDVSGLVQRIWQHPNGNLYFRIDSSISDTYCQKGWWDTNMYIPAGDPNYAFYYGLLLASISKQRPIYLGNISYFNGTVPCNITQTGYGIVLL